MKGLGIWICIVFIVLASTALAGTTDELPVMNGSKGDMVKKVQTLLVELDFLSSRIDGNFGKVTEKAVKAFQTDCGIETTGIVDDATYEALHRAILSNITEFEALLYVNVLDTVNSLKQIHMYPDTIKLLGAVVMNPKSDNPRTVVYISYKGQSNKKYTDYFWKDMNDVVIKNIFGEDCYTGHDGRMPIEQLDLKELRHYESYSDYVPNLSNTRDIVVDY